MSTTNGIHKGRAKSQLDCWQLDWCVCSSAVKNAQTFTVEKQNNRSSHAWLSTDEQRSVFQSPQHSSWLFTWPSQMNMTWMNKNLDGQLVKSWDMAVNLKADKQLVFSHFSPSPVCLLFLLGQAGNGDFDNSVEKGSLRTVSRAKLKCHYASLLLAETAAGICLISGCFHTKSLSATK